MPADKTTLEAVFSRGGKRQTESCPEIALAHYSVLDPYAPSELVDERFADRQTQTRPRGLRVGFEPQVFLEQQSLRIV